MVIDTLISGIAYAVPNLMVTCHRLQLFGLSAASASASRRMSSSSRQLADLTFLRTLLSWAWRHQMTLLPFEHCVFFVCATLSRISWNPSTSIETVPLLPALSELVVASAGVACSCPPLRNRTTRRVSPSSSTTRCPASVAGGALSPLALSATPPAPANLRPRKYARDPTGTLISGEATPLMWEHTEEGD